MKAPRIQRDQVIQAALDLLDQDGLEGLTLRKLAQALHIQAPSLYWHFDSKQALIDGMADALLQDVAIDLADGQPWERCIGQIAGELRQALLARRDGARVFAGTYVVTDNVLRTSEALISAFIDAGADTQLASTCSFSVTYYVLGFVMEEQALGPGSSLDLVSRKQAFVELARQKYPNNWRASDAIFSADFSERFRVGLDLMIDGVRMRIQANACRQS